MGVTYEINASGNFEQRMAKAKEVLDKVDGKVKDWKESVTAVGKEQKKWLEAIKTPQDKYIENLNKIKILQERGKLTAEEAGKAAIKAYDSMNSKLRKSNDLLGEYVTRWISVGAAIGAATSALSAFQQAKQASRDTQEATADSFAQFAQMAQGRDKDIATAHTRNAMRFMGSEQSEQQEAASMVMSLMGMNELGSSDTFARLRGSGVISGNMGATLTSIGQIQEAMAARNARVTPEQVVASQLEAAKMANKRFEDIMQYGSKAVLAGTSRGMSFTESLGTYTALTTTQSVERAADAFNAFMEQSSNQGLITRDGMSFLEIQDAAKKAGYTYTGPAFTAQVNVENYRKMKAGVSRGLADPQSVIERAYRGTHSGDDPISRFNRARLEARQSEADLGIAREAMGEDQRRKEGAIARFEAYGPWYAPYAANALRWLPLGAGTTESITGSLQVAGAMSSPGMSGQSTAAGVVDAINKQTKELMKATPKAPPTATVNP